MIIILRTMANKKKRVYGTKKQGALDIYSPLELATLVVGGYDRFDPTEYAEKWINDIKRYQNNYEEQMLVVGRLATYYDALKENKEQISDLYHKVILPKANAYYKDFQTSLALRQGPLYNAVKQAVDVIQQNKDLPKEQFVETVPKALANLFTPGVPSPRVQREEKKIEQEITE